MNTRPRLRRPWLLALLLLWPLGAGAEVYQVLGREMVSLANLLGLVVQPGGERRLVLNGQPLRAQLSHTDTPPEQFFQRLLARRAATPGEHPLALLGEPLHLRGEGWQLLAAVDLLDEPRDNAARDFLVIALPTPTAGRHAVWSLDFQRPGGFRALLRASGAAQVPGPNLRELPLPGGSRRIFSLSQRDQHGDTHLLGYRSRGSVTAVADHFRRALDGSVATLAEDGAAVVLHARRGRQQINLRISAPSPGEVLSILQIQQRPGSAP